MTTAPPLLQFEPFSSAVEAPFWHLLSQKKVDLYRLSEEAVPLRATYSNRLHVRSEHGQPSAAAAAAAPARLCVGTGAFEEAQRCEDYSGERVDATIVASFSPQQFTTVVPGSLINTNTIEEFKKLDKEKLFAEAAAQIWQDITTGDAVKNPARLCRFLLVTFADLKKYKFYYWFAFPALTLDPPATLVSAKPAADAYPAWMMADLQLQLHRVASPFFLMFVSDEKQTMHFAKLDAWASDLKAQGFGKVIFGFADPGSMPTNPGWPLRNFLVMLKQRKWATGEVDVLALRVMPRTGTGAGPGAAGTLDLSESVAFCINIGDGDVPATCPKAVGWERNAHGKLSPRMADLAPLMDPTRLADTAVDLNLKLMRWRLAPSLQLEKIASTKCLLLGAGTLGCYVARCLMGWGVRHITFVDSARVSFSNPVRQPLFDFDDCLEGGKPKAQCAADHLKKIFPGVTSAGHMMSIPMPGHAVPQATEAQVRNDVIKLEELISEHDVVYLLMDSRESRWLPTVIGAALGKIVINAAMGFDTYLVMRHGSRRHQQKQQPPKPPAESPSPDAIPADLGCYFCNDVVAPTDSLSDRTLDQQCTVTRPGLSAIASACSVELMVTLLHHELGPNAPADLATSTPGGASSSSSPLGLVPHQIRGFIAQFHNLLIVGRAYDKCTACSDTILNMYEREGFEFLLRAFNNSTYLEDVTGLPPTRAVLAKNEEVRKENDIYCSWLAEHVIEEQGAYLVKAELWQVYLASRNHRVGGGEKKKFNEAVKDLYGEHKCLHYREKKQGWENVRLINN